MRKASLVALLAVALLTAALFSAPPVRAQSGCDDSPENPTLVLAGLAGGVYAANQLRSRVRARRHPRDL